MFAYCNNNPVSCIDPTGEAGWHWAIGAVIVVACAAATIITCGGFAGAVLAVGMVSSGVAATTTASTIAAAAFIGSATAYGVAALTAASESESVQDFYNKGNWGTVASTAGAAFLGAYGAYLSIKSAQTNNNTQTNTFVSRGSTGRTQPRNLSEQLAMEQVKSNPLSGSKQLPLTMNDSRWPASEGWVKMASYVNGIEIHFVYSSKLQAFDDFKFMG